MEEFGQILGQAVSQNYDQQIADMHFAEQQRQRSMAMAEAKSKLFADDMDFQNAANEHDNPIIKEKSNAIIQKIGQYARENPDWMYNPSKRIQVNLMKRELKDNPDLIRGVTSDDAFKRLNADLQEVSKSPNQHNQKAYDSLLAQKQNYLKYGNQRGEEAAKTEGRQPFVYSKPKEFLDLAKRGFELGNNFADVAPVPLKNGRSGAWETIPNEKTLDKDAYAYYVENKEQFDQQHPENPLQAAKDFIRSGIKKQFNYGDNHFAEQMALMRLQQEGALKKMAEKAAAKGDTDTSFYEPAILNNPKTVESSERLKETFGPSHEYVLRDNKGTEIKDKGVVNFYGDIADANYKEDGKYTPDGKKTMSISVTKPLLFGKENNILIDPKWSLSKPFSGDERLSGDLSDYEINPEWKDKVKLVKNKDGVYELEINGTVTLDARNAGYKGAYNKIVSPVKYQEGPVVNMGGSSQPQQSHPPITQNGFTYTWNPKINDYE